MRSLLINKLEKVINVKSVLGSYRSYSYSCGGRFESQRSSHSDKMAKPSVYITRQVNRKALELLEEKCKVTSWTGPDAVPRDVLLSNISNKTALFCMLTDKIDSEVLDAAGSSLKIISTMSVGYDHLDLDEIKKRDIRITYTPDVLTDATAELAVGLLLATSRRLIEASEEARNGGWKAWSPFWMCGPGLHNSVVGIAGFGRIGQEIARRVQPFKPSKIIYFNRSEKADEAKSIGATRVDFENLLQQSDFIIVSISLMDSTKHLFNKESFEKMKRSAVFINTSRGGVVDQDALIEALENETIWGAGLDVTTPEPLPLDSKLFKLKNCVVLPHIGSASIETRNDMAELCAKNILAFLNGEDLLTELKG